MNDKPDIRVIFVEDDADVRLGSTQALELAGLAVDGFASVEEGGGGTVLFEEGRVF